MAKATRRLGRGLDSLVSPILDTNPEPHAVASPSLAAEPQRPGPPSIGVPPAGPGPMTIPIDAIEPNPFQPREVIDREALEKLKESIRRSGLLQPVVVRRNGQRYQIVAGERRWRAAKECSIDYIHVVVRDATDEQMLELALVENIQREDLNPIERARAYRQFGSQFGLTPEQIGERVGEDRSTVTNYIRLLELPEEIQRLVGGGGLSMGHARCLLGISNERRRLELARSAANDELSVRALEHIARQERQRPGVGVEQREKQERVVSAHVRDMERRFEEAVRTKVTIVEGKKKGTGRIVLEYYTFDDFGRIAKLLGVRPE